MPPPVSFIDITSIPFTRVVTLAEFNVANEIWFRFISATPQMFGTQTSTSLSLSFNPVTKCYESDGTTQNGLTTTGPNGANFKVTISTYYIKITRNGGGATDGDFTFTADTALLDMVSPVVGDIIVNDDENYPATLFDSSGNLKTYISNFPGGEEGAILPDNTIVWHDRFQVYSSTDLIVLLDNSFNYIGSFFAGADTNYQPIFATDITNNQFYYLDQSKKLWTLTPSGVATDTGYTLSGTNIQAIQVNEDGTLLYWVERANASIHVLDLSDGSSLPDLYTVGGWNALTYKFANTIFDQCGDMFVMPNGNVVTWYQVGFTFPVYHLIVVDSSGSLLFTYTYTDPIGLDHLAYINGDSDHILIWLIEREELEEAHFGRLTLASGVIDQDFSKETFEGPGRNQDGEDKFGPSNSCTFLRVQDTLIPPTDTGTVIINKVTVPGGLSQSFDFVATGFTPGTFTLTGDGDSRTYLNVPTTSGITGACWAGGALAPGSWASGAWAGGSGPTYGINEIAVTGYVTTYLVSNGSSHNNITVGIDEIVVVTVTNTLTAAPGGGIYKIDPAAHKRNDTLWNEAFDGTYTVKIPDPFGITGLVGD